MRPSHHSTQRSTSWSRTSQDRSRNPRRWPAQRKETVREVSSGGHPSFRAATPEPRRLTLPRWPSRRTARAPRTSHGVAMEIGAQRLSASRRTARRARTRSPPRCVSVELGCPTGGEEDDGCTDQKPLEGGTPDFAATCNSRRTCTVAAHPASPEGRGVGWWGFCGLVARWPLDTALDFACCTWLRGAGSGRSIGAAATECRSIGR